MTVHPADNSLKSVIAATRDAVAQGRPYVNGHAAGGYTVTSQRTQRRNSPHEHVVTHVWLSGKLLRKADWQNA